ncbi:MAG: iron ABC transporter permease [Planctomycetes bacterium]|nr:iron ABC transporter permease [Planctomycetota bacterium]
MKAVGRAVVALVVLACLAPALAMLYDSLRGEEGFSLDAYSNVLREERQWTLLLRSVAVSSVATLLALVWGVAVGWTVARLRGAAGATLETLSVLPLLLPSIVVVMGWIFFLGQNGVMTNLLKSAFGLRQAPINIYSPLGAAFVMSLSYFPCVSILAAQGFRSIDPGTDRAACLAAGPWRRAWHIWRPLLTPYLASGGMLVFLLSFSDFGVPSALMVNVYPIEVFTEFSAYFDVKRAIATAVPPVVLVAAIFVARQALLRARPYETLGSSARPVHGNVPRPVMGIALLAIALSTLLPVAFLAVTAGGDYAESLRTAGDQLLTSLRVSLLGMIFLVAGGLLFAAAYRGLGRAARHVAEALVIVPLIVPGTAVGLGILFYVTREVWPVSSLYPGPGIVAYAAAARYMAFPALILAAALAAVRRNLLQAAAVSGAGPVRTGLRIVGPLIWPGLGAAATISFLFCLGELSASVLVNPPGTMTLPVRIASLLHFGKDSIVASLCLILTIFTALVLVLGMLLVNRPLRVRLQDADRTA